jgi:hypothetical protein
MADKKNTQNLPPAPRTPEDLEALAERLVHHADSVQNPATKAMVDDMRQAAAIISAYLSKLLGRA